jgi:hypothetical protein
LVFDVPLFELPFMFDFLLFLWLVLVTPLVERGVQRVPPVLAAPV